LASLLYDPPHSLVRQSWAPRQQRFGTINADGYGVGWYQPSIRPEPARFRRAGPMWADRSLASLARVVCSATIVASVRSATPPAPSEETGAAPFTAGPWLFSLNGVVADDLVALRSGISAPRQAAIEGASDSEVLFAVLLDRLDRLDAGETPGDAIAEVLASVSGRLNLLLCDADSVWATASGDSLWWRPMAPTAAAGPGFIVASEPLDDDSTWTSVADGTLLSVTRGASRPRLESLPTRQGGPIP
jgi:glutamine amidotransferase